MIPKIIHQTWKDALLPPVFETLSATWKEIHPDWEYKLWTDESMRSFVMEYFPCFIERYDEYPRMIQRADAFRYFLLLKVGGLYVDLDFECLENIFPLIDGKSFVLGKEPIYHCQRFSKELILCNAWIAAEPGHDFTRFVCDHLRQHPTVAVSSPLDVLTTTGPFILTDAYLEYTRKEGVTLLDSSLLYPLNIVETGHVLDGVVSDNMQQRIDRAYAVHYFFGTW